MQELFDNKSCSNSTSMDKKNLQKCYMNAFLKCFTVLLKQKTQKLLSNTIENNDPIV